MAKEYVLFLYQVVLSALCRHCLLLCSVFTIYCSIFIIALPKTTADKVPCSNSLFQYVIFKNFPTEICRWDFQKQLTVIVSLA